MEVLPAPMAHRTAPISLSVVLGHASANAVKAIAGGWSTCSSAFLTFPLHSLMSSARRQGSEYHFKSLWYDSAGARTHDLPVVRQTVYHRAITPVYKQYYSPNKLKFQVVKKLGPFILLKLFLNSNDSGAQYSYKLYTFLYKEPLYKKPSTRQSKI